MKLRFTVYSVEGEDAVPNLRQALREAGAREFHIDTATRPQGYFTVEGEIPDKGKMRRIFEERGIQ